MPEDIPPYNWTVPVDGDNFKTGWSAVRALAADIAATVQDLATVFTTRTAGGEARYLIQADATIAASSSGAGTRIPFGGTAEYTHADVSRGSPDASVFTLNRAGLWLIDTSVRLANIPGGTRVQVGVANDTADTMYRANGQFTGAGQTTLDYPISLTKRFPVGQKISVFAYTSAVTQPNVDTTSAAIARTAISLTWLRP